MRDESLVCVECSMRQNLGPKKIKKYRELTGLPVVGGFVRGNTEHRVDLILKDGSIVSLWPDGTLVNKGARAADEYWKESER